MASRLAKSVAFTLIGLTAILGAGCETEEIEQPTTSRPTTPPINIGHEVPAGVMDLYGTWYKKPEGQNDHWAWFWGNISLSQKGTELSGWDEWERYGAMKAMGWVKGNKIHLDVYLGTNIWYYLDGPVNDSATFMRLTRYSLNSGYSRREDYGKISDVFRETFDPVTALGH